MSEEPPILEDRGVQGPEMARRYQWPEQRIEKGIYAFDASRPIYPAEDIGLPSEEDGYQNMVVGEVELYATIKYPSGTELTSPRSAAIIRVSRADTGDFWYELRGLGMGGRDEMRARDATQAFGGDDPVKLGCNGDDAIKQAEDPTLVSAAQLWGDGWKFVETPSSDHLDNLDPLELRGGDGVVWLANRSANRTVVIGNVVKDTSKAPQQPGAGDYVALGRARVGDGRYPVPNEVVPPEVDAGASAAVSGAVPGGLEGVAPEVAADAEPEAVVAEQPLAEVAPEVVEQPAMDEVVPPEVDAGASAADVEAESGGQAEGAAPEAAVEAPLVQEVPDEAAPSEEESGRWAASAVLGFDGAREGANPAELAMQELRDQWGIPETDTREAVERKLNEAYEQVQQLRNLVAPDGDFARAVNDIMDRFNTSLSNRRVSFRSVQVNDAQEQLDLLLRYLGDAQGAAAMPVRSRQELGSVKDQLFGVRNALDEVIPQGYGEGFMNTKVVADVLQVMAADPIGHLQEDLIRLQDQIEKKRIAIMGYEAAMGEREQERFKDERIAELAAELGKENISPAEIERAVTAMRRYLDDAIADGASPVRYPKRVVDDDQTTREGGGKRGEKGSSRTLAAEMAVDMLRPGAFNIEQANRAGAIEVDNNGNVTLGQHRAAALMTLYGRNWIEEAQKAGHRIERK